MLVYMSRWPEVAYEPDQHEDDVEWRCRHDIAERDVQRLINRSFSSSSSSSSVLVVRGRMSEVSGSRKKGMDETG